jgi:hypothetical protein
MVLQAAAEGVGGSLWAGAQLWLVWSLAWMDE